MAPTRFNQIVLIFPYLFSIGLAIHCFQCNSQETSDCEDLSADEHNSTFYQSCTGEYLTQTPFCRKVYSKNLVTDEVNIYRGCGWILKVHKERKDNCRKVDNGFLQRINCVCFTAGCNASEDLRSSPILTITTLFIGLLYIFSTVSS